MRVLLLFLLLPVFGFGQVVEPKIHPGQIGAYSAPDGNIGQVVNGVGAWVNPSTLQGSLLLPNGSVNQTLRYSGGWVPSSLLVNNGSDIGIGVTTPIAPLHVGGIIASNALTGTTKRFLTANTSGFILDEDAITFDGNRISVNGHEFGEGYNTLAYAGFDDLTIVAKQGFHLFSKNAIGYPLFSVTNTGKFGVNNHDPTDYFHIRSNDVNTFVTAETTVFGSDITPGVLGFKFFGGGGKTVARISAFSRQVNTLEGLIKIEVPITTYTLEEVARFEGRKFAINTTTPVCSLDVAGNFRLTTRNGTATTIAGWGSDNISRDIGLGAGLSISGGILSNTIASTAFLQNGNAFGAAGVLGTNDANTMRIKANSYGITINNTGYIQLDDTPTGPPSTPPAGSIFYSSNSQALFFQEDAGAANTVKILTDKPVNALLLLTSNTTPGGENYNIRCDANAGAFTITLGASLVEGKPYLVRCTRNSTNAITFSAASGYTLGIDTDTALNPTTLVSGAGGSGIAAPAKIYLIQRIGTVINIK